MKTSDEQKELVQALFSAKKSFPRIAKNKEGQAGNRKFKYAPLDVIMDNIDPVLWANGLMITQGTDGHELVTRLEHISGQWREIRMPVNAEHANMQSYGIEITYRRRYCIPMIVGITTEEDIDIRQKNRLQGVDHTKETGGKPGRQTEAKQPPEVGAMADVIASMPPLDQAWKDYFDELAEDVVEVFKNRGAAEAAERVGIEELDNEQRIHLEARLPSNVRSALKKEANA